MDEPIRRVHFRPYRPGMGPWFRLTLWDTGRTDYRGVAYLRYRLTKIEPGTILDIFEGDELACSPLHAIDSDQCVASLMGFLCLRPGDTDEEYFQDYTPAQLAFCSEHAEALQMQVINRFGEG